jgi:hypothetical protein
VGVVQRHADLHAAVLKDQHVLDVRARAELLIALALLTHVRHKRSFELEGFFTVLAGPTGFLNLFSFSAGGLLLKFFDIH